jgi:hypothetical protein
LQIDPNPTPGSNDIVQTAVDRAMRGTFSPGTNCPQDACKIKNVTYKRHYTVDAAPEYVRIHINLLLNVPVLDKHGKPKMIGTLPITGEAKNMNSIQIEDVIDLTGHMTFHGANAWPVRYKLVSAPYHAGPVLKSGHYIAAVTGPKLQGKPPPERFFCNDDRIGTMTPSAAHANPITRNPLNTATGSRFDLYILFYVRIWPTGALVPEHLKQKNTADKVTMAEGKALQKRYGIPTSW